MASLIAVLSLLAVQDAPPDPQRIEPAPVVETAAPPAPSTPTIDTAPPVTPTPTAPTSAPVAPAQPEPPLPAWLETISLAGFVDVYGDLNFNFPDDHQNFIPGTGSTAKRANEAALNLAGLTVDAPAAPIGGKLQLVVGTGTQVIHGGEPAGVAIGAAAFDTIYQAYVSVAPPFVEGLTLDAGVFSSHIGFEGFISNTNWNYTRGWLGELVPYYQTGVRATYALPMLKELSFQLHVLNGWQIIGDNNDAKSFGQSVAWNNDWLTLSLNGWEGPELAGDNDHWRFLGDLVLVLRPLSWLAIAASADIGHQQFAGSGNDGATWWVAGVYGRVQPLAWLAIAARVEHVDDPDNGISGFAQTMNEGTLTVELIPTEHLSVKVEGRADISSAEVFSSEDGDFSKSQALVLVGAVASF